MLRTASRAALRTTQSSLSPARTTLRPTRRFISTNPPHLQRSFKSSLARWAIAGAGIYWYNTSPVFAEYPENNLLNPNVEALATGNEENTIDQLTASSRNKRAAQKSQLQNVVENASEDLAAQTSPEHPSNQQQTAISDGAQELEHEAEGEGAFNPLTGEINWDCPCLGGMAYGPCGPQFREAFSCFVYSTEEPKGMECIDKFQAMQDCFRANPEVYKGELEDDEEHMADVEGFEQEKQQLRDEVEQHREKAAQSQSQKIDTEKQQKRIEKKKGSKTQKAADIQPDNPPESPNTQGEHMSATGDSAEPGQPAKTKVDRSGYSQKKESSEGAPSKTVKTPQDKRPKKAAQPESELVPKATHDARDS